MSNIFLFGYGYVAQRLTQHLQSWTIAGTKRPTSLPKPSVIPALYTFDDSKNLNNDLLDQFNNFLISIPPTGGSDPVLERYLDYFKNRQHPIHWIGYLSATSVYGDHSGAVVTEESETKPTSDRGIVRLYCEQRWLELGQVENLPVHVFRLSGIYGPKRNPFVNIVNGTSTLIDKPNHVFSRIHVDDICQTLIASIQHSNAFSIYNLADDYPASSADVIEFAYHLLGIEPPARIPYEKANLSEMARDFYRDHKRVSNNKIKQELGISLLYPSYKEGLRQCFAEIERG